jgi:nitrate reductase (NAD(P)H)
MGSHDKETSSPKKELDQDGEYVKSPKYQVEKIDKLDPQDEGTPDGWIPRHPDLIRLTGRLPLNAEPPTTRLMEDLITPNSLHYVRNHAAVPKLSWESHKVSVYGLVNNPKDFSMDELVSMKSLKIPITFACDGNRRKEINMIEHSAAFNWGPAGVSTAVWTGVLLRDLLLKCGVKSSKEGAKFVCFDGSDELAKGGYGTSIPLEVALNPHNDILLAYHMNDEPLPPDHGFPVRLVIPGFVGGRNIKWLKSIHVEDHESESWYHWHDNKVLPPFVTSGNAESEGWWYKPEFTLYSLNVNSVIVYPKHEEWLDMKDGVAKYKLRGYAYTGGGKK